MPPPPPSSTAPPPTAPRPPGRRSILRMIALLLAWTVAGATLNVAVAWGLAVAVVIEKEAAAIHNVFNDWDGTSEFPSYTVRRWTLPGGSRVSAYFGGYDGRPWDNTATVQNLVPRWGADYLKINGLEGKRHKPFWGERVVEARGWPYLSMWAGNARAGYHGDRSTLFQKLLPRHPIWPGFAINTLFYAGVLWVLCCGPFALRRMIRRRRGQCPACAYPIGQSPVCTECGAAVTQRGDIC